jgi:hypothetical protein
MEQKIREMMAVYHEKSRMPCAVAHYIANYLEIDPALVGKEADAGGVRLTGCQLGLFGYGRKGKSNHKITGRKIEIGQELIDLIRERAAGGKISCAGLWKIADDAGIIRCEAGNAADGLGIKISPCQLGAF